MLTTETAGSGATFVLPAGDYFFAISGGTIALSRKSHVAQITISDSEGKPLRWAHVLGDLPGKGRTQFMGAADERGKLTLRWSGKGERNITLSREDKKTMRWSVRPGMQKIVF